MADQEHSPDQTLKGLLSDYNQGLNEAAVPNMPDFTSLWSDIESELQHDIEVGHGSEHEFDEVFLSAYTDGELLPDDPEVKTFEQGLIHRSDVSKQMGELNALSDLLRGYTYRAEASCTLDVVKEVITTFQADFSNQPSVIPIHKHSKRKAWVAIPLATAAAVLFLLLAGTPFSPGGTSFEPQTLAFEPEAGRSEEMAGRKEAFLQESAETERGDGERFRNFDLGEKPVVSPSPSVSEGDDYSHPSALQFLDVDKEGISPVAPSAHSSKVAAEKRKQLYNYPITLASAEESLDSSEESIRYLAKADLGQRYSLTAEERLSEEEDRRSASEVMVNARKTASAHSTKVAKARRGIPTAEAYVMMYCNDSLPTSEIDSTSFMETCLTGI